jgi:hypothetical protein
MRGIERPGKNHGARFTSGALNTAKGGALDGVFVAGITSSEEGATCASGRGRSSPPVARPAVHTVERTTGAAFAFRISWSVGEAAEGVGVVQDRRTGTSACFLQFVSDTGLDERPSEMVAVVDSILDLVVGIVNTGVRMALAQRSSYGGEDLLHGKFKIRHSPHIVTNKPAMFGVAGM